MVVLFFASVAESTKCDRMELNGISSIKELKEFLEEKFPVLKTIKYSIAVNHQICHSDVQVFEKDEIALLPPFSGG